ncbi:MAG: hypothetical protein WCK34_19545, partial [Bacteroidota bacterium]
HGAEQSCKRIINLIAVRDARIVHAECRLEWMRGFILPAATPLVAEFGNDGFAEIPDLLFVIFFIEEIILYLSNLRLPGSPNSSLVADLAFYAGRFMDTCDWKPFFKAAFERNPVSVGLFSDMELPAVYDRMQSWPNESIYDLNRLALPDEVVNFQRGDGIEKAFTLVNIARSRHLAASLEQHPGQVVVKTAGSRFVFATTKNLVIPDFGHDLKM